MGKIKLRAVSARVGKMRHHIWRGGKKIASFLSRADMRVALRALSGRKARSGRKASRRKEFECPRFSTYGIQMGWQ